MIRESEKDITIETPRLLLRPWQEQDAAALYTYASDPRVGPIAGWQPHTSVADSLEVIRGVLSAPETYAVVLKASGQPVGSVGLLFFGQGTAPIEENEAEIGYWIGVPFWGQGLIPEAVAALLARCFGQLGRTGVWCGYYKGNERSRRVQEKCGFLPHHAEECVLNVLGDKRVEYFTYLSRADYLRRAEPEKI